MTEHATRGICCPTLTPVDGDGAPCIELLLEHCRWVLAQGCAGIVLFGTTGEANSFTTAERRSVLEAVVAGGIPAASLIAGTGCCAAGDTVELTTHALSLGVHRMLVLPPFYYKNVSDRGVIDAYARTIDAVGDARLRFFFYRIPQLSGVDIHPPVIEALLSRFPATIAGLKDSSGDWASTASLCDAFGPVMDVMVGSERFLSMALAKGAAGCVTATANLVPHRLAELYDTRDAALQQRAVELRDEVEKTPVIPTLKAKTAERTGDARWRNVRPPLVPL
jgi:4-hydroxy-tetrahydrodipicolinate synthase